MVVAGWKGEPTGIARLYRVDVATGESIELAASLDRNIMPAGPGYPGGVPQVCGPECCALSRVFQSRLRETSQALQRGSLPVLVLASAWLLPLP